MKKRLALIIVALISVIAMSIIFISCSKETYTVSYDAGEDGYIYYYEDDTRIDDTSATFKVKHGGVAPEIDAVANVSGYVFDKWSDGVTTETRHDKNVKKI